MSTTLQHLLEDVLDNLEDSCDLISTSGGRLDDEDRSMVAEHLAVASARIEEAIARLAVDGNPDTSEAEEDLEPVARRCISLARDTLDLPEEAIASKLQTIKYLIERNPGGLRNLAGLA